MSIGNHSTRTPPPLPQNTPILNKFTATPTFFTCFVADHRQVLDVRPEQSLDQVFGNAAKPEASDEQFGAILNELDIE